MKNLMKLAVVGTTVFLTLLGGCATGQIDPANRDTTGTYDGVWIAAVNKPRASRVSLPGNWTMSCEWDPFELYFTVEDGRVQVGKLESRTAVSKQGDFRIDVDSGDARMRGGVMSGNGKSVQVFSGNFSGSNPGGKYTQFISSIGSDGCSAKIRISRYDSAAS